jgi:hypothetical protein
MTNYWHSDEVQHIGEDLVKKYHQHLIGQRIEWLFRNKAVQRKGKHVLGTARLVTGLAAFLSSEPPEDPEDGVEPYFVIEIAEDTWRVLDRKQRTALVDHELMHCTMEEKFDKDGNDYWVPKTRPHDLEEFKSVVERHGFWRSEIEEFAEVAKRHFERIAS